MKRLLLLRIVLIMAFGILAVTTRKRRYRWMLHYLMGSGASMRIPQRDVEAVSETLLKNSQGCPGVYGVYHSLDYQGSGFQGRPELFYMVGGFTYHVSSIDNTKMVLSFEDIYDWHPAIDDDYGEEWFTSPTSRRLVVICAKIFGEDYFPISGWPSGLPGISNMLWADLESVGAKPFTSLFEGEINIEPKDLGYEKKDTLSNEDLSDSRKAAIEALQLKAARAA